MPRTKELIDMVVDRLPDGADVVARPEVLSGLHSETVQELTSNPSTSPTVLALLARIGSHGTRKAVAMAPNCPLETLLALRSDTARTVADTAERAFFWRTLADQETPAPAYDRGLARQIHDMLSEHDRSGVAPVGLSDVFDKLTAAPEWLTDTELVQAIFEFLARTDKSRLRTPEFRRLVGALLAQEDSLAECEDLLFWTWGLGLVAPELLQLVHDNADVLQSHFEREIGANWQQVRPREWQDGHEFGWSRVGMPSCPDSTVLVALATPDSMARDLAFAQAAARPHLAPQVAVLLAENYRACEMIDQELLEYLPEELLFDLPVSLIFDPYADPYRNSGSAADASRLEDLRILVSRAIAEVTRGRPEAWDVLQVIGPGYEGTARELLAAMQNL